VVVFALVEEADNGERDEDAEADREESNRVDVVSVSLVVISKRRSSFPRGYEWVSLSF
jgi:hypothetical protein